MKRKFLLAAFLCSAFLALSACNGSKSTSVTLSIDSNSTQEVNEDIYAIYKLYQASGGTLTYEEWLATIKGEKGDKGDPGQNGRDGVDGQDGKDGKDGTDGKDGKDGTDGKNGVDGKDGSDGQDGTDGKNGADGSSLLTGNGEPPQSLGKNGDSYIDLSSWDFYIKVDDSWSKQGNIKGESATEIDENPQGLEFYLQNDNTYAVGIGTAQLLDEIVIPESYKGKPVTTINASFNNSRPAFYYTEIMYKTIVIPNSIKKIGSGGIAPFSSGDVVIKYLGTLDDFNKIDFDEGWLVVRGNIDMYSISDLESYDGQARFDFEDTDIVLSLELFDTIKMRHYDDKSKWIYDDCLTIPFNVTQNYYACVTSSVIPSLKYGLFGADVTIKTDGIVEEADSYSSAYAVKGVKSGTTTIELSWRNIKENFTVLVSEPKQFSSSITFDDAEVEYDGNYHTWNFIQDLPDKTFVYYCYADYLPSDFEEKEISEQLQYMKSYGYSFAGYRDVSESEAMHIGRKDEGSYKVYALLECPGYIPRIMSSTLTIKNSIDAYKITFVLTNCTVKVYIGSKNETGSNVDVGPNFYSRNKDNPAEYAKGDSAQFNFEVIPNSGYYFEDSTTYDENDSVHASDVTFISGNYNKLRKKGVNVYNITKIGGNITITINCTATDPSGHKWGADADVAADATAGTVAYKKATCSDNDGATRLKVNQSVVTYASGSTRKDGTPDGYTKLSNNGDSFSFKIDSDIAAKGKLYLFGCMDGWGGSSNQPIFYYLGNPNLKIELNGEEIDFSNYQNNMYGDWLDVDSSQSDNPSYSKDGYIPVGNITVKSGINEFKYTRLGSFNMLIKDIVFVLDK